MRSQLFLSCWLACTLSTAHAATVRPVPLVQARASSDEVDDSERGAWDYIKMGMGFDAVEMADEVASGHLMEKLAGGCLPMVGGHLWGPRVAFADPPETPSAAIVVGVISTVMGVIQLGMIPIALLAWVPFYGWVLLGIPLLLWLIYAVINSYFQWWVFPRALQLIYSDAYAGNGGGEGDSRRKSKKKGKKKHSRPSDEDDE
jgi:hypothetical protein